MPRVKTVLGLLGFDVSGVLDVQPDELVGRRIQAQLQTEEREDPLTGKRTVRLRVPYLGYQAVDSPEGDLGDPSAPGNGTPF